jgi:hypothetical protein
MDDTNVRTEDPPMKNVGLTEEQMIDLVAACTLAAAISDENKVMAGRFKWLAVMLTVSVSRFEQDRVVEAPHKVEVRNHLGKVVRSWHEDPSERPE